jgi:hypothetical protein
VGQLEYRVLLRVYAVIPRAAAFQAERGISQRTCLMGVRSLGPLVQARAFGMTPHESHH